MIELPKIPEAPELSQFPLMSIETMESLLIPSDTTEQHYQQIEIEDEDWNSPYITVNGKKLDRGAIAFHDLSAFSDARTCIFKTIDVWSTNINPKIFGVKVKIFDNPLPTQPWKYQIAVWCEDRREYIDELDKCQI